MAEEDEAGDVLQRLRLGVAAQPLLTDERTGAGDFRFAIAARRHDPGDALGVAALGGVAPGKIAGPPVRKVAAGA